MNNKFKQWRKLCEEYHVIKGKHDTLFIQVTKKFKDIAVNLSQENPTDKELLELESLKKSLQEINTRMEEFIQKSI